MTSLIPDDRRAIVLGASIAGLLTARVLCGRFAEVVLLERDELSEGPAPRKGTPHAVQPHGLLARGREILETLFPGISDALIGQGGLAGDVAMDVAVDANRQRFARGPSGLMGVAISRLALEAELRRRVRMLPAVRIVTGVDMLSPVHDVSAGRVTAVRYRSHAGAGDEQTLGAVLVVDCTGRGSQSPSWLRQWGYEQAPEERVVIGFCYTTAHFRRDAGVRPPLAAILGAATPELPRPYFLIAQEPGEDGSARWAAGFGGYAGDHVEPTLEAIRDRARAVGVDEIASLAERGETLGPVIRYHFPYSQRRRYERLQRFPRGYLLLGDALASFNPIYGQGMTAAACQAIALDAALAGGKDGLARRFFRAAAKVIDAPWQLAVGGDLALPNVPGPRALPVRIINAYIARLQRAATHDAKIAVAFIRVIHLVAAPASLFSPGVFLRVMFGGGRRGAAGSARAGLTLFRRLQTAAFSLLARRIAR
jgi:2-polyprenyl-6-methoxyphenol hydroxylase-like FAD-dependent oxidoreductase